MIDLAEGFDAYYSKLRARSPHFCRELARRARKLAREAGELRIAADARDASLLRKLLAWKSDQWRRTSHVDKFEQPWLVGLLDALLAIRDDHLTGVLSGLYVGDKPVAAQFGLRSGDLFVGWFTAYDTRFRKYSPGLIQLKKMTEELAATGISAIDMGGGAKNYYKETLKSRETVIARGIVTNWSVLGTAHRVRNASRLWASRTLHQHPSVHHAADQMLRRTGVARRIYGRLLQVLPTAPPSLIACRGPGNSRGSATDRRAVTHGPTMTWSSGPAEGRVNCIKMIKRQMSGRAGLPLLRKRVLLTVRN